MKVWGCTIDALCENIAKQSLAPSGIRFLEDRRGRQRELFYVLEHIRKSGLFDSNVEEKLQLAHSTAATVIGAKIRRGEGQLATIQRTEMRLA